MADTTRNDERRPDRTPEEIAADIARAEAEAAKFTSEAGKARAEAREAVAKAREAELKAAKAEDDDAARRAGDEFHHVYRFLDQVSADSAKKCMSKLTEWHRLDPGCPIEIIFDSPGGAVFPGLALFDHIRQLSEAGHEITTGATGITASMAGILTQAGDTRWMTAEGWFLIHRVSFMTMGATYEVEDRVEHVKRIEKRVIEIFTSRSDGKLTSQKIKRNWDRKDWWLDSDQCLEFGIVDEIRGPLSVGGAGR